jgi:Predicted membrane protein (DUF2142)
MADSSQRAVSATRARSPLFVLLPFVCFALLAGLWALASPVFSVPDENAHATKAIAQAHGQVIGYTVPGVKHIVVDLPDGYEYSPHMLCFAYHPEQPANCGVELGDPSGSETFNTWVGAYNPIYYAAVGWPSLLFDGNASIYAMRIASVLLGAALLALAFQAAVAGASARWTPLAVGFAAAPMCLYLIGSVNPNGAELAAAVALWMGLLRLLESFDPDPVRRPALPRWYLWLIVTIASVVLVNARSLGPLWLVIVVALCFVMSGWQSVRHLFATKWSYAWLAVIAVGGLFSVAWTLSGGSLSAQAEASDAPLVGGTFWQGLTHTFRMTPDYLQQAIGYFGWFDAPLPVWVYWFFVAAFAALVLPAMAALRGRALVALLTVLAAAVVVPPLIQGYSVGQTGIIWQGRYGLFLYLGIAIAAAWLLERRAGPLDVVGSRLSWIAAGLLAVFGTLAFGLVLVRYVIGARSPLGEMLSNPQWEPPFGWIPLVVTYGVVSVVFAVTIGAASSRAARREAERDEEAASFAEAVGHA